MDQFVSRVSLVPIEGIPSSYTDAAGNPLDISALAHSCFMTPDAYDALKRLKTAVDLALGTLRLTEVYRSWAIQQQGHLEWLEGKRTAYMAPAGQSFHCAGRGIDIDIDALKFEGIEPVQYLQKFWDISRPIGWHPIIVAPNIKMSECWHFEFPGIWEAIYAKMPNGQVAKCSILDAGQWDPQEDPQRVNTMFVQAQLIRVLGEPLDVDGVVGPKTKSALLKVGLENSSITDTAQKLCSM